MLFEKGSTSLGSIVLFEKDLHVWGVVLIERDLQF